MPNQETIPVAIGLDLGGTNVKYGLVGSTGKVYFSSSRPAACDSRQSILQSLMLAAEECREAAQRQSLKVQAIGAGCPGNIDVVTGLSLGPTPHLADWEGAPVGPHLATLGIPVFVDNDANMAAYGEYKAGAGRQCRVAVAITLGTGIGGGIILDGEIFRGSAYNGAELGHVCIETQGRLCACGNRGCMERYAGGKSIVDDAREAMRLGRSSTLEKEDVLTPRLIFEAAAEGDTLATEIVEQMIGALGAGLSSIVNILNPDVIIIGGGISDAGPEFINRIETALRERVMKPVKGTLHVVRAELGNDAGFVGAGLYAITTVFGRSKAHV